jgi:hypothetical protein
VKRLLLVALLPALFAACEGKSPVEPLPPCPTPTPTPAPAPEIVRISGAVIDWDQVPVHNVQLVFRPTKPCQGENYATFSANGIWYATLAPGPWVVTYSAAGYGSGTSTINVWPDITFLFTLPETPP